MKLSILMNDLYVHALAQEPLPRGHEINNFGRPFRGHLCFYILNVFCMPVSREKLSRNNALSLYDLYGYALTQEPLPCG